MLLSSTDQSPPNNPSSSSTFLHLTNSSDELGHSHHSRFSIRDYAFSYRSKNIEKSWPFSSKSLQLCLKHGISDPLPPMQLLTSVITHPPEDFSLKKPTHVEEAAISYRRKSGSKNGLSATTTTTTSGPKSKTQVGNVNKNPRKKIGLIVKPGGCVDTSCPSESMALRTCPICKTFSSASNTTLNAHIDQCLSVDSEQQPVISKPNKPRVTKPRLKVKTMVDIYATAKEGTLEDLDRRNGTKWAIASSYSNNRVVSDNKPQVSSNKGRKRSLLRGVRVDEDAPSIGPVYIDAKGQKLRILSEFNDKTSREHENISEKSEGKGNESFRKRPGRKKHRKLVPQSRKLIARKGDASKIPYSEEGRGVYRSEYQRRSVKEKMLMKRGVSRNGNKKGTQIGDEPSENALVLRGPSQVSTDLSETVSTSLNSQNSWKSQVSGKSWALSKRKRDSKNASFVSNHHKVFASEAKGFMKLKKTQFDFSENEDEDEDEEEEDRGKWESEMTQERELSDYDDWDRNGETNEVLVSSNPSDNDYDSFEETGDNNKGDDDMLEETENADAEFESMVYEKTSCETAEQRSSFMEVDLDPIPIPGPPGSFLPSPWDMGTDAIANSSVITSQVQSSQDLTDRNSSESPRSNFAAPPESLHNMITIDKRQPSRFRDNDQSCCCQRKEKAFQDTTTFGQQEPHMMIHQDFNLLSKSVPTVPSNSNPVLRLMGKDLMVINQREETSSHGDLNLSPPPHPLHRPFNTSTSFYNIP